MDKGLLKFQSGEVKIYDWNKEYNKGDKIPTIFWNGEIADIKQTTEFLDKHMPKGNEKGFDTKDGISEDGWMMTFFYGTCPNASYWYDGTYKGKPDPDDPDPRWIHSS